MVEIPDTFSGIHSVKTVVSISATNAICDTDTHTHFLSPALCSLLYTRGHVELRVIPGTCWGSGRHKSPFMPVPEYPGQAVCHTSLEERENTDEFWTAPFGYRRATEKRSDRERGKLGNLVCAKPPQLAPLMGRVALIPKQSDLGLFYFWAMI